MESKESGDMSARSPARGVMPGQGCPVSDVREKLRQVGLRPTRQRISLAWILFGKGNRHVTAEMLYEEALHARVPVSLATIYNTLHQFTEAGLLRPLMVDGNKAYFDTNPSEHHHFFVEDDQMLIDLPKETVQSLIPVAPEGYEVIDVELLVRLRRREAS